MKRLVKKGLVLLMVASMALGLFVMAGCGSAKADMSAYQSQEITIVGLTEEEFTVTPQDLAQLPIKNKKVTSATTKKDVTVQATGPTLDKFLEQYGYEPTDFETITFIAADGYTKQFKGEYFLVHTEVIMAICHNKEPLAEEEMPLRLVIPNATGDNWVHGVIEIRFE